MGLRTKKRHFPHDSREGVFHGLTAPNSVPGHVARSKFPFRAEAAETVPSVLCFAFHLGKLRPHRHTGEQGSGLQAALFRLWIGVWEPGGVGCSAFGMLSIQAARWPRRQMGAVGWEMASLSSRSIGILSAGSSGSASLCKAQHKIAERGRD